MPATAPVEKLLKWVNHEIDAAAWRLVLCTEDAIREEDVPEALRTLRVVLAGMQPTFGVTAFVRVRTPVVLAQVLDLPHVDRLRGFVIPKTEPTSFQEYADQVIGTSFRLMPILESPLMTDRHFRETLRTVLLDAAYQPMIDCLRIGANDLMGHLGIRRDDTDLTIYETPVGITIHEIINEFRGLAHFAITAPVFECFAPAYDGLLRKEVHRHIMNGLFGQTVIHPRHIRIIRDMYKVSAAVLQSAKDIVNGDKAVKGVNGKMDEHAPHLKWALSIIERHRLFGDSAVSQTLMSAVS
jgi:citrate lyase beta subunit